MRQDEQAPDYKELALRDAVEAVAASARRLFPIVSEQQARDLAAAVLRDLEAEGIRLARIECDSAWKKGSDVISVQGAADHC